MQDSEPTQAKRARTRAEIGAVIADLVCVVAFTFGGLGAHDETKSAESTASNFFEVVWPYALSALLVHDLLWRRRVDSRKVWPGGVIALVVVYVLGMAMRAVTGRGMAVGFLIVAAIFLTVTMLGWRLVWTALRGRQPSERG